MGASSRDKNQVHTKLLQSLGFTEYEAATYLILLQHNPATAYEIGNKGGLIKANVYATLESLVRRGAALPVSRNPARYIPVAPKTLMARVSQTTTTLCETLAKELTEPFAADNPEYVWMLEQENDIHEKLRDMVSRAKSHVWFKGPHAALLPHRKVLRDAVKRGIKLVIILFGTAEAAKDFRFSSKCSVYLHEHSGIVVGAGDSQIIVACDYEEALSAKIGQDCEGAYTRNQSIVYMAESLIRHEIYLAEIIGKFPQQIEQSFGKSLLTLRQHYLPTQYITALKQTLNNQRT